MAWGEEGEDSNSDEPKIGSLRLRNATQRRSKHPSQSRVVGEAI